MGSYRHCRHYLGVPTPSLEIYGPDLATPFVFETRFVLDMIAYFEKRSNSSFDSAFSRAVSSGCYEFAGYSTYLLMLRKFHSDTFQLPPEKRYFMSTFRGPYHPHTSGTIHRAK